MEMYEINALFASQHLCHREGWEQTRMLAFVMARTMGAKAESPKELFSLPWDDAKGADETALSCDRPASDDDFNRLRQRAQYIIDNNLLS